MPGVSRLGQGIASALRCGRQTMRAGSEQRGFRVTNLAVVYVLRGHLQVTTDAAVANVHDGEAFHRFPDQVHDVRVITTCESLFCAVPGSVAATLRTVGCPGIDDLVIRPGLHPDLIARWQALTTALARQSPVRLAQTAVHLQELLIDLHLRAVAARHPAAAQVEAACRLLDQDHAPGLEAIARRVGLAPSTLRRVFREVVGVAPWTWHLDRRMDRARERLLSDPRSVAAVAEALGWSDAATFTRCFTARVGLSPRAWRLRQGC